MAKKGHPLKFWLILALGLVIAFLAFDLWYAVFPKTVRARQELSRKQLKILQQAVSAYHINHGDYPPDLQHLSTVGFIDSPDLVTSPVWKGVGLGYRLVILDIDKNIKSFIIIEKNAHGDSRFVITEDGQIVKIQKGSDDSFIGS